MGLAMIWGFTGTRHGMTPAQRATVIRLLSHPLTPAIEAHHGDCVGADDEFDQECERLGIRTVIHPPENPAKRAWCYRRWRLMTGLDRAARIPPRREVVELPPLDYLDRNRAIVDAVVASGALIGAPYEPARQPRGGTWSTLRYADERRATMRIVLPDGAVERFL